MSNSKLLLIFLVLNFIISFASSVDFNTNITTTTTTHQCSALFLFKQNLPSFNFSIDYPDYSPCEDWLGSEGYYPIMMNWHTSLKNCCDWDGVTCDHSTGDVIGLDLSCGMLQGTLHPNTSLFNLPHLQTLNLAFNDFTGSPIPSEIGSFSNTLTHLNISACGFSGQVTAASTIFHKFVSLDLSSNYDISLEPRVFINMLQNYTHLEELSLEGVNISSVLPAHLNISSSASLKLLNLHATGLQGKLPHNILKLQSLEELNFSSNSLTGEIPWEISRLPKLVSLDLSTNHNLRIKPHIFHSLLQNSSLLRDIRLIGVNIGLVLPTYLNISSSLKSLYLRNTSLKGKLPDNIFNLQYLEELSLSANNNLVGPVPRVNATIPLKRLYLSSSNFLSGEIPDSFGHFKSLTRLDLSNCSLTGPLPKPLVNLRHLTSLYLSSNKLNGTLPSWLFSLQSLQRLSLDDNQFAGQIDVQTFGQLTNLTRLDLSYNNFSGDWELDTLLSSLTNLFYIRLSYSGLSIVTTSNAIHHVNPNLRYLYLASCKIKVFPESLRSMRNLQFLDLSSNEIHGHIPPSICNLSKLRHLDLSNNRFDGVIPECFRNITPSLRVINLGNNRFQGIIPNVYENCGGLEGLILNGNQLEGEVPSSLSKCQSLKLLDMGNNHLNGTFPSWLGDFPNLQALILKSNSFHGRIVPSSTVRFPFQTLRVLDLSHNAFVGPLPAKFFQSFNAMKNVVRMSTQPEYLSTSGIYYPNTYTIVDLSSNTFEGEIPNIIGTLNSLKVLNLSHNNLIGQIPYTLGNLTDIESLDLSWNQLTGEIPRNLTDIKGLTVLNLSQNKLRGRIPQGNQFNTINETSFGGNLGLCGFPLPKCEHGMLK